MYRERVVDVEITLFYLIDIILTMEYNGIEYNGINTVVWIFHSQRGKSQKLPMFYLQQKV